MQGIGVGNNPNSKANLKYKDGERHQFTQEECKKAQEKSAESRRIKRTFADILKIWAEKDANLDDQMALKVAGISEDMTNKATMVLPLLENIKKGDTKSMQMAIELLGEDRKKELEIKRLTEEIEKLKLEQEQLKQEYAMANNINEQIQIMMNVDKVDDESN